MKGIVILFTLLAAISGATACTEEVSESTTSEVTHSLTKSLTYVDFTPTQSGMNQNQPKIATWLGNQVWVLGDYHNWIVAPLNIPAGCTVQAVRPVYNRLGSWDQVAIHIYQAGNPVPFIGFYSPAYPWMGEEAPTIPVNKQAPSGGALHLYVQGVGPEHYLTSAAVDYSCP